MVAVFSEYFYMLSFNLFVISYIAYYKIGRFIFLSIPIPVLYRQTGSPGTVR